MNFQNKTYQVGTFFDESQNPVLGLKTLPIGQPPKRGFPSIRQMKNFRQSDG